MTEKISDHHYYLCDKCGKKVAVHEYAVKALIGAKNLATKAHFWSTISIIISLLILIFK